MKPSKILIAATAAALLAGTATAGVRDAEFSSGADTLYAQPGMFAGATYRIRFDRSKQELRGRASLAIAGMMRSSESHQIKFGQGLELASGKAGKPAVHIAGAEVGDLEKRLSLSKGAKTALIVAGGVVLVFGALMIIGANEAVDDVNEDGGLGW